MIETISFDDGPGYGMPVAWTMTMSMTRPLTLILDGALTLAKFRILGLNLTLIVVMARTVAFH